MSAQGSSAAEIIRLLELQPHPEGGHFREMFRDPCQMEGRAVSTAIYYLLKQGERSHWHRVDAAEVWHHYAGAPLALHIAESEKAKSATHVLGKNLAAGERPQIVVAEGHWQAAEPLGDWTLVGCTVAPGFEFAGFELARKDWSPGV
jgi:predicted cupin superfamily sugar epimerase